jgi:class 3 adenylate cyclase/tetratricopeptide (TPR) repeat protein
MRCSACGTENPPGFKFCGECGNHLVSTCPTCGAAVAPGLKFCGECGNPLSQTGVSKTISPSPPAAERRLVTVMFADLVGFTAASQSRDPEEVRELLGRYFEVCRRLVELYGGTLEKFIGDAVMAVWGTPVANEDDAERAVRSALDLLVAVQAMGEEVHLPELRARAAVLTGDAAVTLGAVGQGMVAGDLVNTASRLQGLAPPGAVLVGEAARRLTEASIVYEDFGAHEVKGRNEAVHAWRALRVVAARGGSQRSSGLEPPFVGRDRELRLLKEMFHVAVDESRAHLVSVTGIAGIGKSRLAWEFFKYIDGLAGTIRWHAGRCLAYGEGVAYWALAEMVRTRAGILEAEGGEAALAKLRQALEDSVPDPDERRWLEPRLAQLIGLEEPGAADRQDLFAAWRRFYERLSEQMPTVMVFEDMQWADPSLVEFIDYLLDWSRDHRLFIVTLGRAGEARGGGSARGHTALHLEPLSRNAMEALITAVVPGLATELVGQIMERAEGVPLYAVETIRMLLDRGLLIRDGSSFHPAGAINALDVPESLHTLIAARLDGLESSERHVLKQSAVLGKTFTAAGLVFVSGRSDAEVEALLASLVRKEVLTVRADPRSPDRGQYGFLQDLVRQVAYETLSRRDRKELHLQVASYLEKVFGAEPDEIVEVLASHYLDAYREVPDAEDSAAIKERARQTLTRAGERAASLGAAEEAQGYYERAIELASSELERADLEDRAGVMAWRRGLVHAAIDRFESAHAAFTRAGDDRRAAGVEVHRADIAVAQGQLKAGAARLRTAYDAISHDEPNETIATVAAHLGRMLSLMNLYEEAEPYLEAALAAAEELRLQEVYSQALNSKAIAMMHNERHQEASLLLRESLEVALQNQLWPAAFRAFNNLGVALHFTDRNREGLELFSRAIEYARRLGDRSEIAKALSSLLGYKLRLGLWDEALEDAHQCEEIAGPELLQTSWLVSRFFAPIEILGDRGELAEARAWADRILPWLESDQPDVALASVTIMAIVLRAEGREAEAFHLLQVLWRKAKMSPRNPAAKPAWILAVELALAVNDLDGADELLAPVLARRPGHTPPSLAGLRLRFKARLSAARGESAGIEQAFSSAAHIFREAEMPFYQAATQLELAEWLQSQRTATSPAALLQEARAIFERLKARPWLERVARVATAAPV